MFLKTPGRVPQSNPGSARRAAIAMSSSPGDAKRLKRGRTYGPEDICDVEVKKADLRASRAITAAAEKINDAAESIVNCVTELKPALQALANRSHREIVQSAGAVKQLVRNFFLEHILFHFNKFDDVQRKIWLKNGYFSRFQG